MPSKIAMLLADVYVDKWLRLIIEKYEDKTKANETPVRKVEVQGSGYLFDYLVQELDKKHSSEKVVKVDIVEALEVFFD